MTTITKLQQICLSLILALSILTLVWISLVYADAPGDLDVSFGDMGIVTTTVGSGFSDGYSVALQSDGKIVVAGYADGGGSSFDLAVVRYTITGSLDNTFKSGGIVTTPISNDNDHGIAVAIQADDKIVVAGDSVGSGDSGSGTANIDFAVVRYKSNGELDSDFGDTGIVTTPIGSGNDWGEAVAVQPDGKIVVAGSTQRGSVYDLALTRYTITGSLDSTFNGTGIVTNPTSGLYSVHSVAIQSDGKIVAVGDSSNGGGTTDVFVSRYTITGSLDTTFNNSGSVTTPIGNGNDFGHAVVIQPNDKIVVVGRTDTGGFNYELALVRYTITGSLDTTFNDTGIVTGSISSGNSVAIQPNGKIVVAGSNGDIGNFDFAVVRYNVDGNLDTTFNGTGIVTTSINNVAVGRSVAMQSDGKILVAGGSGNDGGDGDFAVVRYLGDGSATFLPIILKNQ